MYARYQSPVLPNEVSLALRADFTAKCCDNHISIPTFFKNRKPQGPIVFRVLSEILQFLWVAPTMFVAYLLGPVIEIYVSYGQELEKYFGFWAKYSYWQALIIKFEKIHFQKIFNVHDFQRYWKSVQELKLSRVWNRFFLLNPFRPRATRSDTNLGDCLPGAATKTPCMSWETCSWKRLMTCVRLRVKFTTPPIKLTMEMKPAGN